MILVYLKTVGVMKTNYSAFYEIIEMTTDTFSGWVSTLKQIRPKQSRITNANEEQSTRVGFLATQIPYLLEATQKVIQYTYYICYKPLSNDRIADPKIHTTRSNGRAANL
jgi:hypothetical protein